MFHFDNGLFLTARLARPSTSAVASPAPSSPTPTPTTSPATSSPSPRPPPPASTSIDSAAPPRPRNAVRRAARLRLARASPPSPPATASAPRCCWPMMATHRSSTPATSSSAPPPPPSRPNCPHADVLVMESTFGLPRYRMPPRDTVIDQLLSIVHTALADEQNARHPRLPARQIARGHPHPHRRRHPRPATPGHLRDQPNLRTMRHAAGRRRPAHCDACHWLRQCRLQLSTLNPRLSTHRHRHPPPRHELLPPRRPRPHRLHRHHRLGHRSRAPNTAGKSTTPSRSPTTPTTTSSSKPSNASHPSEIHCTHGPVEFVDLLRDMGFNAFPLAPRPQKMLF